MRAIVSRRNIFVTGGGGFIGANLIRKLVRDRYTVHLAWKKTTNDWRLKDIRRKLNFHDIELTDTEGLDRLFQKINPAAIFHLAAHGAYERQTNVTEMIDVAIRGTSSLLFASKNIPYTVFVNTGSSSEYGHKEKPMKETDVLYPASFYAATKASATLIAGVFAKEFGKPVITLRLFSVYGPYEEPTRFVPTVISRVLTGKPIELTKTQARHDFVYIDDVIEAYLACLTAKKELSGEVVNIGSGKQYTNEEVARLVCEIAGKTVPIALGKFPNRRWDTTNWVADISHAKSTLAWRPTSTVSSGLTKTLAWIAQHLSLYAPYNA